MRDRCPPFLSPRAALALAQARAGETDISVDASGGASLGGDNHFLVAAATTRSDARRRAGSIADDVLKKLEKVTKVSNSVSYSTSSRPSKASYENAGATTKR